MKKLIVDRDLRPVKGKTRPREEMAEAHRYAETDHKQGNVVIRLYV